MSPLVYISVVLALGIASQWIAWRLKTPSILFLLPAGFALGQWLIHPGEIIDDDLLFPAVSLAVAIILFEGGLTLKLRELRSAGLAVRRLCSVGAGVSWVLTGAIAHFFCGLHWGLAGLLGAILVVTGPTVVAPLLRTINPTRRIQSIVKWEGIVIDPIGATLALLVFQGITAATPGTAFATVGLSIIKTLVIGFGLGGIGGLLITSLLARNVIPQYLQSVFLLVCVAVLYTISDQFQHESGLLTVTVLGIALANQKKTPVKHIITFKENLAILLISTLFIVLSGRITMAQVSSIGLGGILLPTLMILLVRPLSIFAATVKTDLTRQERIFLACLAPRGIVAAAVTSVFAIELSHAGDMDGHGHVLSADLAEQAALLTPLTFSVIVGTVAFSGLVSPILARRLGVAKKQASGVLFVGASPWIRDVAKVIRDEELAVLLVDTNQDNVTEARLSGLPAYRGNILSEAVEEELDLAGIGNLLALTPNDETNSMAVNSFSRHFGRSNVFQFRPRHDDSIERDHAPHHFRGRNAFHDAPTYPEFVQHLGRGLEVKKTTLTDQFSIDDFHKIYGNDVVLLFAINESGALEVYSDDNPVRWKRGYKVVALVKENDDA